MNQVYDPDEMERLDRVHTDDFASKKGWTNFSLKDPIDDLDLFFQLLPGQHVLDAGCGWGRYVFRFFDNGLGYNGIDHSVEMLAVAQESNPGATFQQASIRKIPYLDNSFHGVWSCCVLPTIPKHHLEQVLREHARVLKPGGILYVVMPAAPPQSNEDIYTDEQGEPIIYQAHYWLEEFSQHFLNVGLTIIEEDYRPYNGSMYVAALKP